jgi:hypothetical protein
MADYPAPVAAQIQPPDPTRGLNTFSALLGIKQQQQALQTGQYLQETASAESQQAQQKNSELQKAQSIAINGAKSGAYTNPDNTFNRQKMADDLSKLGPYVQAMSSSLLSQANEVVQNQAAHQNLTVSRKKEMSDAFFSLAQDPQLDNSKIIDAIEKLRNAHPGDDEYSRLLTSQTMHLPNGGNSQQLRGVMSQWAAASGGEQVARPSTLDTGGQVIPGQTVSATGQFLPAQGGIGKTPGPGLVTNPLTGGQAFTGGAFGTGTAPIGGGGWQPAPGQVQMQGQTAPGIGQRLNSAVTAANQAPAAMDALRRARDVMDRGVSTGGGFGALKDLKNALAGAGFDTSGAADANELAKNLARYEAQRANLAGNTDAARSLVELGSPNTKIDATALRHIITQSMANEAAIQGYTKAVGAHGNDPNAAITAESRFRAVPNLIQAYEYGMMRSKSEADEFLQRHNLTKSQIAASRAQLREIGGL